VAFWDFDDPAIPDTETAATAVASSGLLKLAKAAKDEAARAKYRVAAEATITALVTQLPDPDVARGQARSGHPHRKLLQQAPRRTAARRGEQVRIHRRRLLSARMLAGAGGGA
jgi:hypothetical protein